MDSEALCELLLEQAGVAITPGSDFGHHNSKRYVRFSYANTLDNLHEGVQRINRFINQSA
jgi:aspartate/methionine/tyrosine aminotransferase